MAIFEQHEAISGKQGRAYIKIKGNNEELFYAKSIEASIEKSKSEIKTIGSVMTGFKTTAAKGSGTMSIFYVSPIFRQLTEQWVNTGRDTYFDLLIENDDPESGAGRQTVLLTGVNIDSVVLAKLDGDTEDALDEEVPFTFNGFTFLEHFKKI